MKDEVKKSQSRLAKEEKVEKLSQKFGKGQAIIFWDYSGISVPQLQQLREQLAQTDSKVSVAKNTLISLALKNSSLIPQNSELLVGPTAVLETPDEIAALKILASFIRSTGFGKIKFGFVNRKFVEGAELEYLANLPSKEQIFGQIAITLQSPVFGLINVLEGNLKNLVYVLSSARSQASN